MGTLGLGAAALGNLYAEMTDDDAHAIVAGMWDGGVRYFDTAPHYGLGLSERRLGQALASYRRDEYLISTKIGRLLEPNPGGTGMDVSFVVKADQRRRWDFTRDGVLRSLEDSLARMSLDRVDVLYIHDPEDHLEVAIEQALPALVELRESGVVAAIGVGSTNVSAITAVIETGGIDIAMVAGRYTLLEQPANAQLLPAALRHGVRVVAVGVYNSGLLATPEPDPNSTYEYGAVPPQVLARAQQIARICRDHGVALPHAAVQFPLRHQAVANVTVGIGRPEFVPATLERAGTEVPQELWASLAAEGLIPPAAG